MKTISSLLRQLIREQVTQLNVSEGGNTRALIGRDPQTGVITGKETVKMHSGREAYAEPIDLASGRIKRQEFKDNVIEMLKVLDDKFEDDHGSPIWDPNERNSILDSGDAFSGSSRHLFAPANVLSDEEFVNYKPSVGDVDLTIPEQTIEKLFYTLNQIDIEGGFPLTDKIVYIGHNKKSEKNDQINALFSYIWDSDAPNGEGETLFQIDFEASEYEEGKPTAWAKFSHSSAWEDVKEKISGVSHKYILEVIAANGNPPPINVHLATPSATAEKPKISYEIDKETGLKVPVKLRGTKTLDIISGYGSRYKLLDWQHNGNAVYKYLVRAEREDATRIIKEIFIGLFKVEPTEEDLEDFESFTGILKIMSRVMSSENIIKVYKGYVDRLYGKDAEQMSATDPAKDSDKKDPSIVYFKGMFPEVESSLDIDALKSEFYGKYKIRSKNESVDYNNIKKFIKEVLRA